MVRRGEEVRKRRRGKDSTQTANMPGPNRHTHPPLLKGGAASQVNVAWTSLALRERIGNIKSTSKKNIKE